jgi:hypothetical protein
MKVQLCNIGGELNHRDVTTEQEAAEAAIEMIREAGELHHGDKILVTDWVTRSWDQIEGGAESA